MLMVIASAVPAMVAVLAGAVGDGEGEGREVRRGRERRVLLREEV